MQENGTQLNWNSFSHTELNVLKFDSLKTKKLNKDCHLDFDNKAEAEVASNARLIWIKTCMFDLSQYFSFFFI